MGPPIRDSKAQRFFFGIFWDDRNLLRGFLPWLFLLPSFLKGMVQVPSQITPLRPRKHQFDSFSSHELLEERAYHYTLTNTFRSLAFWRFHIFFRTSTLRNQWSPGSPGIPKQWVSNSRISYGDSNRCWPKGRKKCQFVRFSEKKYTETQQSLISLWWIESCF